VVSAVFTLGLLVFVTRELDAAETEGMLELDRDDADRFGSAQMNVPQMIPVGVGAIQEAPFLGEEDKHKILGDNARLLLGIGAG
jgi:hypothetical protein